MNSGLKRKLIRIIWRLIKNKIFEPNPFILSHLITRRCNCKCEFCLWREEGKTEFGVEEIEKFYQEAKNAGFLINFIWGGEPLMREDCPQIAQLSYKCGFLTVINTNGYFLVNKIKDLASFTDAFIISLDFPSEQQDVFRKCPGLFERAMAGIGKLKKEYPKIKMAINCLLTNENKTQIVKMADLSKKLKVPIWFCAIETGLIKTTGFKEEKKDFQLTLEEEKKIAENLINLKKKGYQILNSFTYLNWLKQGKPSYHCHVPKLMLEVDCNGDVMNCLAWDKPIANLRKTSLKEILKSEKLKNQIKEAEFCSKCNETGRVGISQIWEFKLEILLNMITLFLR